MICCVCKKRIKAKEPKAYFHKGKRKVYGCRTCNEDGTLDAYIDKVCSTNETMDPDLSQASVS